MKFVNPDCTHQRVKNLLNYDAGTGQFTRRIARPGWPAGGQCGFVEEQGYVVCGVDGQYVFAHRLAWFYVHGVWPEVLDHINRDKADNRIANLREVTISENRQNIVAYKNNTSGYKGVHWFKASGKWQAQIRCGGKRHHLGFFDSKEEAARVYSNAAAKFHSCNPAAYAA